MHVITQLGMPELQTTSSQTINGWWKGNGCADPLTRSRNPLLTGSCCIFGGIFGKNAIEGSSSITPYR
jgi:hypothetical protein